MQILLVLRQIRLNSSTRPFDAHIEWYYTKEITFNCTLSNPDSTNKNSCWTAKATIKSLKLTVEMDKDNSWYKEGKNTSALLGHEELHLWIAEYNAEVAASKIRALEVCVCNKDRTIARNKAKAELKSKANAVWEKMLKIDRDINQSYKDKTTGIYHTGRYDKETNHGQNAEKQKYWRDNFKSIIDKEW